MIESEWKLCKDPRQMLDWLRNSDKLTERKARLFAIAFCRCLWPRLTDEREQPRKALEVAERYVEGAATEAELRQAHNAYHAEVYMLREAKSWWGQRVLEFLHKTFPSDHWAYDFPPTSFDFAILGSVSRKAIKGVNVLAREVARLPDEFRGNRDLAIPENASELCHVFRDIFGNPFHPVAFDWTLLRWNDGLLGKLAQRIYDEKAWDLLPVLADALEEAGYTDQDALGHLRGPELHFRGCHVIDLLLNRE
jgi:hypothetical protein